MNVPADLRRRIEEMACDMGVPPEWVLRACIDLALKTCDDPEREHDLVIAVEAVRDDPHRSIGTVRVGVPCGTWEKAKRDAAAVSPEMRRLFEMNAELRARSAGNSKR